MPPQLEGEGRSRRGSIRIRPLGTDGVGRSEVKGFTPSLLKLSCGRWSTDPNLQAGWKAQRDYQKENTCNVSVDNQPVPKVKNYLEKKIQMQESSKTTEMTTSLWNDLLCRSSLKCWMFPSLWWSHLLWWLRPHVVPQIGLGPVVWTGLDYIHVLFYLLIKSLKMLPLRWSPNPPSSVGSPAHMSLIFMHTPSTCVIWAPTLWSHTCTRSSEHQQTEGKLSAPGMKEVFLPARGVEGPLLSVSAVISDVKC